MARILIADDEADFRRSVASALESAGHDVKQAGRGEEAISRLREGAFDLVLSDLRMPGGDGIEVLSEAAARMPDCIFIVMTAFGSLQTAIQALRIGVHDYLLKPISLHALASKVELLLKYQAALAENRALRAALDIDPPPSGLVGESEAIRQVHLAIAKLAAQDTAVLIRGETGTGKELVAKAIHHASPRRAEPFLAVNCGSIPETLLESELFGHRRGAFTGADRDKPGLFQVAGGGTLFLDEIGDMPLGLQPKLLRATESMEIFPVGATEPIRIRARIVSATHRDLAQMIRSGTFRADLYYRLAVFEIALPPLRERREDIRPIAQHLLGRLAGRMNRPIPALDVEALQALEGYGWPGNVRELANVLERAMVLSDGARLTLRELPGLVQTGTSENLPDNLAESRRGFEQAHIRSLLEKHGGNRAAAARALGISLASLYRKLQGRKE
jgi:DNA-binding NtrC family response regulator